MSSLEALITALGDRYTVERELGGGGMSVVLLAREHELDRRVVIKVLSPELAQNVSIERFKREIATLASLQHPQIVPVYHAGVAGGLLYYVMPFVAGESLRARLARDGRLPPTDVIRLLVPLARALAFAHREGVVHRDIKPENILLAQGEPVLADFGIAKVLRDGAVHGSLTSAGMSIGTVTYMAPEQVLADPAVDGRADVYSLAAVGYELLSGQPPFTGSPQQVMSAHVVQPPPPLSAATSDVNAALNAVLMLGLTKEASERPTADAFALQLESAAAGVSSVTAARAATVAAVRAPRGGVARVVGGVALTAVIGAGIWWASMRPAAVAADGTSRPGLAVLPFERIGGAEDAYIAAGLSDELMSQLAEVRGLRIASRTTVRALADSALTPAELGRRLNVSAIIEGSVQRAGEQLRVSTRLVDVRDGSALWSQRYERPMRDLFAVQREIGTAVVAALTPRLGLKSAQIERDAGTRDLAAYDLFTRASFALDQRGVDSLTAAVRLFEEATRKDPLFARAWAGIAEAAVLLPQYGGASISTLATQIRASADRARALDSTLASPYMTLGLLDKALGDWVGAERSLTLAIARQPDYASAHQNLGGLYYTLGRIAEAESSLARAALLEPASVPVVAEFAFALNLAGRVDSARRVIDRALIQDARNAFAHFTRATILERQNDLPGAAASMTATVDRAPLPIFIGSLARLAHRSGNVAVERAMRARLDTMQTGRGMALGQLLADLDTENADHLGRLLQRAIAERDPFVYQLPLRLWWFDRVRGAPEFRKAADLLRLPVLASAVLPGKTRDP